jgi:hypothetical protein
MQYYVCVASDADGESNKEPETAVPLYCARCSFVYCVFAGEYGVCAKVKVVIVS